MSEKPTAALFWDKLAAKYAKKPVPDEAIYQRKLQLTQHFLSASDVVLEFGCGTGSTALVHAPKVERIDATDISPAMIAIAKERAQAANISNVSFEVGELEDFKLKADSYDAVLGLNIMHLIQSPANTLREVHRILKADGIFISSTPLLKNEPIFVRWIIKVMQALGRAPHINFLTKDEYLKQVTDTGFEPVQAWMPDKTSVFLIARKAVIKI
ncbi:class I SAM-dependent methyltransferase [Pseudidiomarina aestuarii]|uniref:class I SAM-dependent methyltransferase n=1 Tax=Pseudidiomarina aestuarii TaxID=624146 RepID=UPI003A983340